MGAFYDWNRAVDFACKWNLVNIRQAWVWTAMESVNWSTVWVCKCEMMSSGYKLALPRRDVCQAPTAAAMGESAAASRHSWWSRATTNHYYAALIFIVAESHVPLVNVSRSNQICARRGTATLLWFKECRKGIRSACLEKRLASIINMNTLEKDTFLTQKSPSSCSASWLSEFLVEKKKNLQNHQVAHPKPISNIVHADLLTASMDV